jgi:AcrR family transcriptional regulator
VTAGVAVPDIAVRVDPRIVRSREAVLATTAELLAEVGLSGVTVEAIAHRSGVAKTTIYRHWPAISQLIIDAVTAVADPCADPDTGTLRGDLLELAKGLARTLTVAPTAKVIPSLVDAAERDPDLARLQRDWVKERRSGLERAFQRAQARGEIGAGVDIELVGAMQSGPLFYRRLVSHEPLSPRFIERLVDAVMAVVEAQS